MITFLIELLIISLLMSLVITVFILLSKKLEGSFRARGRFIIWLVIIARLAIPVGGVLLPSLVSIPIESTTISRPADSTNDTVIDKTPTPNGTSDAGDIQLGTQIPSTPKNEAENKLPSVNTNDNSTAQSGEKTQSKNNAPFFKKEYIPSALFALWLSGAFIFFGTNIVKYNLYIIKLKRSIAPAEGRVVSIYCELCREMGLKSPPALYKGKEVHSPMLFGYFKKKIILPCELCDDKVVRAVLTHELTHFRRKDIYLKLLCLLANSIHWFNPAVYLASSRFNVEMELSCDEITLEGENEEARVYYGKAMLDIVSRCKTKGGVLTTKFDPERSAFGMRIRNILDTRIKKTGVTVICICLAACLLVGVLFGCADNKTAAGKKEETEKQETSDTTANTTANDTTSPAPEVGDYVKVFKTAKVGDVLDSPEIGVNVSKLCDFYVKTNCKINYGMGASVDMTVSVSGYGTDNTVCFILDKMASDSEAFGMSAVQGQFIILDNKEKTAKVYNSYEMDMDGLGNQSAEEQIDNILDALTTEGSFIDVSANYTYDLAKQEMDRYIALFCGIGFTEYVTNEEYREDWMSFTKCEDEGNVSVYSTNINGEEILFKINRENGLFKHASYNGVDHYSVEEYSFSECCHTDDDIPTEDELEKYEDPDPLSDYMTLSELEGLKDFPDDIKKTVRAFLEKDTSALEHLTGCAEGVLEPYNDFEFGEYTIRSYEESQRVRVDVNIEKSPLDTVSAGEHTLIFSIGPNGVNIGGLCTDVEFVSGEGRFFMQAWITQMGTALIPDEDTVTDLEGYHRNVVDFLFQSVLGPASVSEYKDTAQKVFGIEDILIPEDFINEDGNVEVGGHGGYVKSYDIMSIETNEDLVTVTVRTYADSMKTIKAMVIKNTFKTEDDILTVVSSEIIEDAGIGEFGYSI